MKQEILRMEHVVYMENGITYLQNFNLQIYRGEIMGMLSMNGYGMPAFLSLLQVNLPIHDGYIYYGTEKINSWRCSNEKHNRVSVIQAKSSLVEHLTVADNIFIVRQGFRQEWIRTHLLEAQLKPFLEDIQMEIPGSARIEELTGFERIIVELLKAVVMGHHLIVLNDIATLISYEEMDRLNGVMRHYAEKGFSFIYICPHFEDIVRICDRAALFSEGRIQKIILKNEMQDEIIKIYSDEYNTMVQRRLAEITEKNEHRKILLRYEQMNSDGKEIKFRVYEGECLAVQIMNHEIMHEMTGYFTQDSNMFEGNVFLEEKKISLLKDDRIAVIAEQPAKTMIFPEMSYMDNLCMLLARRLPVVCRKGKIVRNIRNEYGPMLGKNVFYKPVDQLTEKQKYQLIYTRVLLQNPRLVVCLHPFKGADLEHRIFIWKMLEMLLNRGISVVILTVNLSDTLSLAERLVVIEENGRVKEIKQSEFSDMNGRIPWTHLFRV